MFSLFMLEAIAIVELFHVFPKLHLAGTAIPATLHLINFHLAQKLLKTDIAGCSWQIVAFCEDFESNVKASFRQDQAEIDPFGG